MLNTRAIALLVTVFLSGVSASPYPLAKSSSCTNGQVVCSSDGSQYALCSWGNVTFQPVAPGTSCRNGAIVASSIGTGASVTVTKTRPAATSASAFTSTTALPSAVSPVPSSSANVSTSASTSLSSAISVPSVSATPSSTTASATSSSTTSAGNGEDYHAYLGNGSPEQGWPTVADWATFDDMWSTSLEHVIKGGCASLDATANTAENNADMRAAILAEGNSTGIDPRFILAIILQESLGCVRVDTTVGSVHNPGLMQSYDGNSTCFQLAECPASEIRGMIHDGVHGTATGPGLVQLIQQTNTTGVAKYYRAARLYNSGSIAANGLLQCGIATNAYCSDVANRMTLAWYQGLANFPTDACPDGDS